jgi:hypothetical protein
MRKTALKAGGLGVLAAGLLLLAFAQLNVADIQEKNVLESVTYYFKDVKDATDYSTDIYFKFRGAAGKYYHTKKKNLLIVEFYDTDVAGDPIQEKIDVPFSHVEMTTRREDHQLMEEMQSRMRDIVRFEFTIKKRFDIDYTISGSGNLITLSANWAKGETLGREQAKTKSKVWKYAVAGVVVVGAAVGIGYLIQSTSDTETGQVYQK